MIINSQIFYLIVLCLVEILGDFSLEKYTKTWAVQDLSKGIFYYAAVVFFLIKSLIGSNILYVNGMWDGISCLLESSAAYFWLGERLDTTYQYFGLGFVIVGIFLLKGK